MRSALALTAERLIEDSRILAAGSDKAREEQKSEEQLGFREETEQLCTTCSVQQAVLHYMFMVACCLRYMFMSACSSAPHVPVCICISALCLSLCTFGRAHSLSPFDRGEGEPRERSRSAGRSRFRCSYLVCI